MRSSWVLLVTIAGVLAARGVARAGSAVVTNGRFTNIYVYPDPDRETWEQHFQRIDPARAAQFTRANIDRYTEQLMSPAWPSYFDPLMQYSGIHPPRFFGSAVATKQCVDAALKDEFHGVLQWDTIRSLSNCHVAGMDPSPQVNLIFSPDIKIAKILIPTAHGGDMCAEHGKHTVAYHAWGLNTPNFTVLPTSSLCTADLASFERTMSHEIVETVSDPAGMGMGDAGTNELGDNCEDAVDADTTWNGLPVQRYWSNFDHACVPRLDPPAGSTSVTWVLGESAPLRRLTGDVHSLSLNVPASRVVTDAAATEVMIVIQTGGDDLRGGNDNADVTLSFAGGTTLTRNINASRAWENNETHAVKLTLPAHAPRVRDLRGVTITTHFGGGIGGDNWNIDKVALVVSFPTGSATTEPRPVVVHSWLDTSGAPLFRFTGDRHDLDVPVPATDVGKAVRALDLVISTGNDDLRGGSGGDNCDVTIELTSGEKISISNVNHGGNWKNWTDHVVPVPLPAGGLKGGDIKSVDVHTGFGGGIGGDNWNVNRVQLRATMQ